MRTFRSIFGLSLIATALVLSAIVEAADPVPPITFGASVTNANGSLTTQLNWSAVGATSCVGSGHTAWNGAKAASGTQALPAITMSGTYTLTLNCTWPGDTSAVLAWTAPTQNTDGSDLVDLAGYRVYHGTSPEALFEMTPVSALTYTFNALPEGTHYFAVSAYNTEGAESLPTASVNKVVTASQSRSAGVTLTVNPIPKAPAGLTVR